MGLKFLAPLGRRKGLRNFEPWTAQPKKQGSEVEVQQRVLALVPSLPPPSRLDSSLPPLCRCHNAYHKNRQTELSEQRRRQPVQDARTAYARCPLEECISFLGQHQRINQRQCFSTIFPGGLSCQELSCKGLAFQKHSLLTKEEGTRCICLASAAYKKVDSLAFAFSRPRQLACHRRG